MSRGVRHEKVDTVAILDGDLGDANLTDPAVRRRERTLVLGFWPDDLIASARRGRVPWRTLVDPAKWPDVDPEEVFGFVRGWTGFPFDVWPSIDALHRKFGRASNHRLPGESPNQGGLF